MVFQLAYLIQARLLADRKPEQITKFIQEVITIVSQEQDVERERFFSSNFCCELYNNNFENKLITQYTLYCNL